MIFLWPPTRKKKPKPVSSVKTELKSWLLPHVLGLEQSSLSMSVSPAPQGVGLPARALLCSLFPKVTKSCASVAVYSFTLYLPWSNASGSVLCLYAHLKELMKNNKKEDGAYSFRSRKRLFIKIYLSPYLLM